MIIGIIKETSPFESRVSATPTSVKKFISQGFKVWLEKNAGTSADFFGSEYISAGAQIKNSSKEILRSADILLALNPLQLQELKKSSIVIGNFQNQKPPTIFKNSTCFALEKLPRLSKAQPFDILSSQNNLSGYQAVIKSAIMLKKSIPMMITSAGTIIPTKFLIIGLGVAGLQAIATAKRLGAKVYAYDIRTETKEQAQSLGAIFTNDPKKVLPDIDVIITSAYSPNKKAPVLIKQKDIKNLKKGTILIDMSISQGGNIEGSKNLKTTEINGCLIYASSNLSDEIPQTASRLYANNLSNFIDYLKITSDKIPTFDRNDDIIKATLIQGG